MLGIITQEEAENHQWLKLLHDLTKDKRATLFLITETQQLWVSAERLALLQQLHPQGLTTPIISPVGATSQQQWQPHEALVELIRCRLQGLGPTTENELTNSLAVAASDASLACLALEQEGYAMQGDFLFRPDHRLAEQVASIQWCERGLLARIHRYTLKKRRNEIKPVTPAEFMLFLFDWHHIGEEKPKGPLAVANTLRELESFPIPACAWESDILKDRIDDFSPYDLDQLCLSGEFTWLRISATKISSRKKIRLKIQLKQRQLPLLNGNTIQYGMKKNTPKRYSRKHSFISSKPIT